MSTVSLPSLGSRRHADSAAVRCYRLVNLEGEPHPVLDGVYESLDVAWNEALRWWNDEFGPSQDPVGIGIEVSTKNGSWRTLRHPCC